MCYTKVGHTRKSMVFNNHLILCKIFILNVFVSTINNKIYLMFTGRGFPIWGIILLVLLCGSGTIGLLFAVYCLFRRQQLCWRPTPV